MTDTEASKMRRGEAQRFNATDPAADRIVSVVYTLSNGPL